MKHQLEDRCFARIARPAVIVFAALVLFGCSSTAAREERVASFRLADDVPSSLSSLSAPLELAYPGQSGHVVLNTGREAFNARIALAGAAERTLDAQYYIWNNDKTGRILAGQLVAAAGRGVRVRLLMDDYGVGTKDEQLAALDAHDLIEVRVYNPFNAGFRSGLRRWANFALGFSRLNRRMHSKTFIVDNSVAITGGRNIGDEYFDANPVMNHRDRDMLSAGPVVSEISNQFDEMWNHELSRPIDELGRFHFSIDEREQYYRRLAAEIGADYEALYPLPLTFEDRGHQVQSFFKQALWAPTRFIYNPPSITLGDETGSTVVGDSLLELLSDARSEVMIESAYFTVMDAGLKRLEPYLESGLDIRVITNSLATTDVWTIHAGYTRNRDELLNLGVKLFEWRADGQSCNGVIDNNKLQCGEFLYSLHAKTVVFDRDTVFVGSFNLNPRSRLLNTETALVVRSRELARRIGDDIAVGMLPENSWRLAFEGDGHSDDDIRWHGTIGGKPLILDREPGTSVMTRFKAGAAARIPLEKYW